MLLKKVFSILAIFGLLWGFSCFYIAFFLSDLNSNQTFELPLSTANSIVVNSDGLIFIGLQHFSRIQVYDEKGDFVKNWRVDSEGGMFYLDISPNDSIIVYTARGGIKQTYNTDGLLLKTNRYSNLSESIYNKQKVFTSNGNRYKISESNNFPVIKKNEKVIIDQGLFLKSITFPHGLILGLFSFVILIAVNLKTILKVLKVK